ncbi:HTH-type transcriptional regulator CynR [Actinomadura rubteroloni]|uniref:HTH-type transcriptional regulator CynR n=1 Tax=Actinomadura rubteroloni TaxID=1926885 RepID=A0A2P4UJL1_9ACTN|nr:LysR family transcriptional regulator [Actinomadura rubteroloni]POM25242.1 HTH-type transcriptional regulator CynR [Actinomadura rubteroloni]
MELRHVEAFLVLAEELHFGRAAGRMGVTQARVSQLVRELEREVGAPLFERTTRRVRLTALGMRFRESAGAGYRQIFEALRDSQSAAREVAGVLRVGYLPGLGDCAVRLAGQMEARHPGCEVVVGALGFPAALLPHDLLVDGAWDVVLSWAPCGDGRALAAAGLAAGAALGRYERAVLVPEGHPLARCETVHVDVLSQYEFLNPSNSVPPALRNLWTAQGTPSGLPLRYTDDDLAAMAGKDDLTAEDLLLLVARGRGLYLTVNAVQKRFNFPDLALVPVHGVPPRGGVPIWSAAAENATIRSFAALVGEHGQRVAKKSHESFISRA